MSVITVVMTSQSSALLASKPPTLAHFPFSKIKIKYLITSQLFQIWNLDSLTFELSTLIFIKVISKEYQRQWRYKVPRYFDNVIATGTFPTFKNRNKILNKVETSWNLDNEQCECSTTDCRCCQIDVQLTRATATLQNRLRLRQWRWPRQVANRYTATLLVANQQRNLWICENVAGNPIKAARLSRSNQPPVNQQSLIAIGHSDRQQTDRQTDRQIVQDEQE